MSKAFLSLPAFAGIVAWMLFTLGMLSFDEAVGGGLSRASFAESLLDADSALLVYSLGRDHSQLRVVTSDEERRHRLPGREQLERSARRLYRSWQQTHRKARSAAARLEDELSAVLLGPVLEELGRRRLVILAEGDLRLLPFGALPDPRGARGAAGLERLAERHEIVYLPSERGRAALARNLQRRRAPTAPLAVVAAPIFGVDDPRFGLRRTQLGEPALAGRRYRSGGSRRFPSLPYAEQEATTLLRWAPTEPHLAALGFDANRDRFLSGALAGYAVVHVATHAVDEAGPGEPALVLSTVDHDGRSIDGFLYASDVASLELDAELVVLSGCRTGLPSAGGRGLPSLTEAFLAAGARSVIASLWNVGDRSTAELMRRLYHHLFEDALPPSRALAAAQRSMARDPRWRHPYHWAGFVYFGD